MQPAPNTRPFLFFRLALVRADYVWYHPTTRRSLGEVRAAGRLTNIRVYNAGHMVAQDQPEAALLMLQTWLRDNFVVGFDELPFPGNIAG